MKNFSVIVPGGLNTDILDLGVDRLLSPGELTLGGKVNIGSGGKSRNMAQMTGLSQKSPHKVKHLLICESGKADESQ